MSNVHRLPAPALIRAERALRCQCSTEIVVLAASLLGLALDRRETVPPGTVRELGRLLFEGPLTPIARLKLAATLAGFVEIDNSVRALRALRDDGSTIEQVETAAVVLAGWPHLDYVGMLDLKVVLDRIRLHRLDGGPLWDLLAVIDHRWRTEDGSP